MGRRSGADTSAIFENLIQRLTAAMDREAIYTLYSLNLALIGAVLLHILIKRKFAGYYVYFIIVSTFAALNLVGSITDNIIATEQALKLQVSLFFIAIPLALVYPVLGSLRSGQRTSLAINNSLVEIVRTNRDLKTYVALLMALSVGIVIVFSVSVTPLLLFRADLYGQWIDIIELRTGVVFGGHKFHWFALAFFDIPLFSTILSLLCWWSHSRLGNVHQARQWRRVAVTVAVISGLLSVSFLHKTFLAYLLLGGFLVGAVLGEGVIKRGIKFGAYLLVALVLLYMAYLGYSEEGLSYISDLLLHRIFEVYPWAAAVTLDLFPRHLDYLAGTSFINFFGLFPYEQVNLAPIIYPYIYNGLETGSAPVPASYEMYANFGWPGFAVGVLVCVLFILVLSRLSWSKSPITIGLSLYMTIKAMALWQSPFWFGALEPTTIALVVFLWALWLMFREVGHKRLCVTRP